MLVKANTYAITRDANTTIVVKVPAYEAKILSKLFGTESVSLVKADKPSVIRRNEETEAARLEAKYGAKMLQAAFGADYENAITEAVKKAVAK